MVVFYNSGAAWSFRSAPAIDMFQAGHEVVVKAARQASRRKTINIKAKSFERLRPFFRLCLTLIPAFFR